MLLFHLAKQKKNPSSKDDITKKNLLYTSAKNNLALTYERGSLTDWPIVVQIFFKLFFYDFNYSVEHKFFKSFVSN